MPVSLASEIEVLKAYGDLFKHFIANYSRSEEEFANLFKEHENESLGFGRYTILVTEHSYYRIANKHVKLAAYLQSILTEYMTIADRSRFKEIYMKTRPEFDFKPDSDIEVTLAIARYLEQVYHCPVATIVE